MKQAYWFDNCFKHHADIAPQLVARRETRRKTKKPHATISKHLRVEGSEDAMLPTKSDKAHRFRAAGPPS